MNRDFVHKSVITLLIGAGPTSKEMILSSAVYASSFVAADGGFNAATDAGLDVALVVGDMDSQSTPFGSQNFLEMKEQDTTDFEKCLSRIEAPLVVGLGFLGGRIDHQMAVQSVLVRYAHQRCLLIGMQDLICVVPPQFALDLPVGTRVSLFPMAATKIASQGLHWPTDGVEFCPNGQIGTSNRCSGKLVLAPQNPSMLLILPRKFAQLVATALQRAPKWSVPR